MDPDHRADLVWVAVVDYMDKLRDARRRWPERNPERLPDRFERIEWNRGERYRRTARGSVIGKAQAALWRRLDEIFEEEI